MLSHMLMRQSATRCFGKLQQPIVGQANGASLTKFAALTSSATHSTKNTSPASVQSHPHMQRWITTLQHKQTSQPSILGARTMSSNHPKIWTAEKMISLACVPGIIVPFLWTTPLTDAIFCTLSVLHSHWGVEAIVVDYIRPALFGGNTIIPNIAQALVWALSAFTLGALYYFNYTDVGIVNAIKMLWKI